MYKTMIIDDDAAVRERLKDSCLNDWKLSASCAVKQ